MGIDSNGGTHQAASGINVTPLIDILLVLLIIFMVIVPITPRGLDALIPQPPKDNATPPPESTVVLSILANSNGEPSYLINRDAVAKSQIEPRLHQIFSIRQQKVMFVKADPALDFSKVAEVIDMGHQANVDRIGLITPKAEAAR